jgi:hypothetical protein
MRLTPNFLPLRSSMRLIWQTQESGYRAGDQNGAGAGEVAGDAAEAPVGVGVSQASMAFRRGRADQQHHFKPCLA